MIAPRHALLAAAWAVLCCVPTAGAADNAKDTADVPKKATNPFLADVNRTVGLHELDEEQAKKYAKSKKKTYSVMLIVNLQADKHEKECPHHCTWLDKQVEAFAEGYTQQVNRDHVYAQGAGPLHFARLYLPSRSVPAAKMFDIQRFPAVILLPAGSSKGIKFGSQVLKTYKPKVEDKKQERAAREKAQKESGLKYLKRAQQRADRRQRLISTQEEKEEPQWGVQDYHSPTMNNLCKWVAIQTGHQMTSCPQDVDRNIASKQSSSNFGKQVIVGVIGLSAFLYIARAFAVGLGVIDYSAEDLKRAQTIALGVREVSDQHVAHKVKGSWWSVWTMLAAFVASVVVGCCASGMYHNFLNNREVLGDRFAPPLSRVTGYKKEIPHFSVAVASVVTLSAWCLIAMGRAATLNHLYFKLPLLIALTVVWMCTGLFMMTVFVQRNGSYLHNTPMAAFIENVVKKL
eukprot:TRINITY_DN14451_c0_g1_i1.p1 TRINITY_DN14451_c0_g1~~TRINITY_DN14451_c0_g1_i1.p1  ORF type:complete len:488 (+),score=194.47 TRINITY_DN14451_c0_g1_i1:89-1465(+)